MFNARMKGTKIWGSKSVYSRVEISENKGESVESKVWGSKSVYSRVEISH